MSGQPRPDRCETCRFWEDGDFREESGYTVGACHRNPPISLAVLVPGCGAIGAYPDEPARGVWPETDSGDWCGEWQAKPTESVEG